MNQEAAEKIFGTLATQGDVAGMGDGITGSIIESITGIPSSDVANLSDFANLLMGRDVSLASRVSRIENKIAVGAEFYDDFNRGDNAGALGLGWIQGGSGQTLGIDDQAAQLKRDVLPSDGRRYAICPWTGTQSDDVTVSAVIHPRGTPTQPATSLFLRSNTGLTEFVYVNLFGGRCAMGRGTRNGNTWNFTQWTSNTAKSYSNSATVEFKAIGNKYQLVIDNVLVMEHDDISGYPIDSAHRSSGFAMQTWTAILQVPQYSGGIASFAVRSSVELSAVAQAQQTAQQANSTAQQANTTAQQAQEASAGVRETAEQAYEQAEVAYAAAARWKDEFVVSSAGVVLGQNEIDLGVVMDVPPGRQRIVSRIIYGLSRNTGALTVQLISTSPQRTRSVIHSTTILAGQVERIDDSPNISVQDGHRISCSVLSIDGDSSVLQCALIGALI